MSVRIAHGDLLDQPAEVLVNAWNRNIISWWLLPQGVSGAIKRRAGYAPFRELGCMGPIPLGISMWWRASEASIRQSVRSAMRLVHEHGFVSVAFPLISANTGGFGEQGALRVMLSASREIESPAKITIVRYQN